MTALDLRLSNRSSLVFAKTPAATIKIPLLFWRILLIRRLPLSLVQPLDVTEKVKVSVLQPAWNDQRPWNDLRSTWEKHDPVYHESRLGAHNVTSWEDDKLVKILLSSGACFSAKCWSVVQTSSCYSALSVGHWFLLRINDDGLSYIEDYHEVMKSFQRLIVISLLWPMLPMWQLCRCLFAGWNQQDAPLSALEEDSGVDGRIRFFNQYFWNSNLDSIWNQPPLSVFLPSSWSGLWLSFKYGACLCPDIIMRTRNVAI